MKMVLQHNSDVIGHHPTHRIPESNSRWILAFSLSYLSLLEAYIYHTKRVGSEYKKQLSRLSYKDRCAKVASHRPSWNFRRQIPGAYLTRPISKTHNLKRSFPALLRISGAFKWCATPKYWLIKPEVFHLLYCVYWPKSNNSASIHHLNAPQTFLISKNET